jgi:hypothetical protein
MKIILISKYKARRKARIAREIAVRKRAQYFADCLGLGMMKPCAMPFTSAERDSLTASGPRGVLRNSIGQPITDIILDLKYVIPTPTTKLAH